MQIVLITVLKSDFPEITLPCNAINKTLRHCILQRSILKGRAPVKRWWVFIVIMMSYTKWHTSMTAQTSSSVMERLCSLLSSLRSGSFLVSDVQFFHFIFCHFEPKRGAPQLNVAQTPDKCCAQDEYALFIQRIMSAVAVVFRRVHLLLNNAAHWRKRGSVLAIIHTGPDALGFLLQAPVCLWGPWWRSCRGWPLNVSKGVQQPQRSADTLSPTTKKDG